MSQIPPVSPDGQSLDYQTPVYPEPVRASAAHYFGETGTQGKPVRQARDRAQYVRQQKGHSFILEWLVLGIFTVWIRPLYFAFSPNHYFHL